MADVNLSSTLEDIASLGPGQVGPALRRLFTQSRHGGDKYARQHEGWWLYLSSPEDLRQISTQYPGWEEESGVPELVRRLVTEGERARWVIPIWHYEYETGAGRDDLLVAKAILLTGGEQVVVMFLDPDGVLNYESYSAQEVTDNLFNS